MILAQREMLAEAQAHANLLASEVKVRALEIERLKLMCKSLDLILQTTSDFSIHPTAGIIGETVPLLSMTASRPPAAAAP